MAAKCRPPRDTRGKRLIVTPWITRNGRRIYKKGGGYFAVYVND
jgi:hypothetical protein